MFLFFTSFKPFKKSELNIASKLTRNLILFKKSLFNSENINQLIALKKKELNKLFKVKVEYLENRNKQNLKISNKVKNSKIFIAYYLNKVRLIDNF